MKTSFAAIAVALASVASAQLADIPSCALQCFIDALSADGCSSLTDFACHCKKTDLIPTVEPCVQKACSAADQAKVITAVEGTCASAGVPITISTPAASAASSAPASSAAAASTPAASSAPAGYSSAPVSSAAASSKPSSSAAGTGSLVTATPSSNGTIATATPSQFTGAAAQATQAVGIVAAAALALAAAL